MPKLRRAVEKLRFRRAARLLARKTAQIPNLGPAHTRAIKTEAEALRLAAAETIRAAMARLEAQQTAPQVAGLPPRTDWVHRPALWSRIEPTATLAPVPSGHGLSGTVSFHHDCPLNQISIRQAPVLRGKGDAAEAGQGQVLDVLDFSGSFASLAVAFPSEALAGFSNSVLIRADLHVEMEAQSEIYLRLNLRHGPNVEKITRKYEPAKPATDFDIFHTDLDPEAVSEIWLDIILSAPRMNRFLVSDLVLSRRPRANV